MKNIVVWLKANKEILMKYAALVFVAVVIVLAVAAGCRRAKSPPPAPEAQVFEISRGSNFMAQTSETIEVEADIFLADRPKPVRTRLRIRPGTWVVPEQMLSLGGSLGPGTVCTENFCGVAK